MLRRPVARADPMPVQPDPPTPIEAEAQRQKTALLYRSAGIAQAVNVVNATLLAVTNASLLASPGRAAAWWGAVVAIAAGRYLLARRFLAAAPDAASAPAWRRRYVLGTTLAATAWASGTLLFMWRAPDHAMLFTGLVLSGMVAGAVPLLAPVPAAFRIFALLVGAPVSAMVLLQGSSTLHWAFGTMSVVFLISTLASARYLHETLDKAIRLGLEQRSLAGDLERAGQAAEAALSERTRLEEEMRRERDFAEGLIDTAQAIVLLLDTEGRIVRFNRFLEELSGRRLEDLKGASFVDTFLPERRRRAGRTVFEKAIGAAQTTSTIAPILARGGREALVEWHDKPLKDSSGRVTGLLAIGQDVTRREEQAASQRLLMAAVEQSNATIVMTDADARIIFVNSAFVRTTGYEADEVLGQNPRLLKSGKMPPEIYDDLWATIVSGRPWRGELCNRTKGGALYWEAASISPITDEHGRTTNYLAVMDDITRRKALEEELTRLATTDPLTGVANRRRFLEELELELERFQRFRRPSAVLMLDVDRFKEINDTHGHAAGDAALRHLSGLVRTRLRRIDLLGRLGGEEFGILLPGADREGAVQCAEDLRRHLEGTPLTTDGMAISLTVSIGVALIDPGDAAPDAVLARADRALYRAKEGGRNRVEASAAP